MHSWPFLPLLLTLADPSGLQARLETGVAAAGPGGRSPAMRSREGVLAPAAASAPPGEGGRGWGTGGAAGAVGGGGGTPAAAPPALHPPPLPPPSASPNTGRASAPRKAASTTAAAPFSPARKRGSASALRRKRAAASSGSPAPSSPWSGQQPASCWTAADVVGGASVETVWAAMCGSAWTAAVDTAGGPGGPGAASPPRAARKAAGPAPSSGRESHKMAGGRASRLTGRPRLAMGTVWVVVVVG